MSQALRILLIEDDLVDRRRVRRMLPDCEFAEAEELEGALELLAESDYDCVLLDLNLPDGDGTDLLVRIQEADTAQAPIIVLTGQKRDALVEACLQAGAQDFLIKGQFDADALERAVRYARERYAQSEALLEQTLALQRSNVELERFASAASHDLQEPLRTLRSMGQLLNDRHSDSLGERGGELLERMLGATERMQALIADLLDLARISTGEATLEPVDLAGVLREVRLDLDASLRDSQGQLVLPEDLPLALGVESQLRRVLVNLIGNAFKFRDPGRPLEVEVRGHLIPPRRRDSFSARSLYSRLEVSISDNGIGVAAEQVEQIFLAFKRLHSRARYAGTGIGLAICKAIVERHGGQIRAEARDDSPGTRFVFTLRASDPARSDRVNSAGST